MPADTPVRLPIVDFSACSLANEEIDLNNEDVKKTIDEMVKGFEEHGCIYLVNHGMKTDGLQKLRETSRQFFNLSTERKLLAVRKQDDAKNGWVPEGLEYLDRSLGVDEQMKDMKECFNIALANLDTFPWPNDDEVPGFRAANRDFILNCNALVLRLCDMLGPKLSPDDPTVFRRSLTELNSAENNFTCLRNLYYPPVTSYTDLNPKRMRLWAHSDFGIFTFLFQDDIGGLEVLSPQGEWFEALPLEGAVMVQSADMLERWTSGRIKAAVHRVNLPSDKSKWTRPRESTAYFVTPDQDFVVKCLDGSDKYPPMTEREYCAMKMGAIQDSDKEMAEKVRGEKLN